MFMSIRCSSCPLWPPPQILDLDSHLLIPYCVWVSLPGRFQEIVIGFVVCFGIVQTIETIGFHRTILKPTNFGFVELCKGGILKPILGKGGECMEEEKVGLPSLTPMKTCGIHPPKKWLPLKGVFFAIIIVKFEFSTLPLGKRGYC